MHLFFVFPSKAVLLEYSSLIRPSYQLIFSLSPYTRCLCFLSSRCNVWPVFFIHVPCLRLLYSGIRLIDNKMYLSKMWPLRSAMYKNSKMFNVSCANCTSAQTRWDTCTYSRGSGCCWYFKYGFCLVFLRCWFSVRTKRWIW